MFSKTGENRLLRRIRERSWVAAGKGENRCQQMHAAVLVEKVRSSVRELETVGCLKRDGKI